jgi:hypothetical protein
MIILAGQTAEKLRFLCFFRTCASKENIVKLMASDTKLRIHRRQGRRKPEPAFLGPAKP